MSIKKRQLIGVALITASVLAAVLLQAFTGRVLEFRTVHVDVVSANADATEDAIATSDLIIFHWRYDIPLAAVFVIGLAFCAWPTRKPSRIISSA